MEYKRSGNCECVNYPDIFDTNVKERKDIKEYWMNGFIHSNGEAKECSCHRKFRLIGRYDRFANSNRLPTKEELSKLNYLGAVDLYKEKLKNLPEKISLKNIKDVMLFLEGPVNCQKTTTACKLIYNVITSNKTAEYLSFSDLISSFEEKEDMSYLFDVDWLFIDDIFENATVTIKTIYNGFYNLLLKRNKPIVLISNLSEQEILESKTTPFYNSTMMKRMFDKIKKFNGTIEFRDDVSRFNLIKDGTIDLWGDE